jgi:pantetheine-phosphate adenylyltransferase
MKHLHKVVGLGGTFDHFHKGHESFLKFASRIGQQTIIGVTDERMILQKNLAQLIEPLSARKKSVISFCQKNRINAKVITLDDPFGPTLENSNVESLACTTETVHGANKINEVREKLRLSKLPVYIHNLQLDQEKLGPINSNRIRSGEINRSGLVYNKVFDKNLKINQKQKEFFANPQGEIVTFEELEQNSIEARTLVTVVGDSTLNAFIEHGLDFDLGVFDKKVMRQEKLLPQIKSIKTDKTVDNQAGIISSELANVLNQWKKDQDFKYLYINGEEDLAAVALVLVLPLNSIIFYGQPNIGIVGMVVTEKLKDEFYQVLNNN